ncbi:MAG TPA: prephenate dehydrogenase/arogenate dehydrogenase family protein [Candidatus Bathyarchaeia archaeon]|nr:prephenate dehydrogenase/arogenate dehydrogenase family protein [Candidatus Bathyarchaeia archaeon]
MRRKGKGGTRPKGTVLIVGGAGRMGRWFTNFFRNMDYRVLISSRNPLTAATVAKKMGVEPGSIEDARFADIVLVSAPVKATQEICLKAAGNMRDDSALVEISAVKKGVEELAMKMPSKLGFLSIHPLFGPATKSINGQDVVIVHNKENKWTWKLLRSMEERGAKFVLMSSRDHDKYMACVQSLHHFAILSLGYALQECLCESIEGAATRSMRATMRTLRSMLSNLDSIAEIQAENPYSEEARNLFLAVVKEFAEKDPRQWIAELRQGDR